jgi:hypothetical protein
MPILFITLQQRKYTENVKQKKWQIWPNFSYFLRNLYIVEHVTTHFYIWVSEFFATKPDSEIFRDWEL